MLIFFWRTCLYKSAILFTKLVVTKILYLRKERILCLTGLSAVPVATSVQLAFIYHSKCGSKWGDRGSGPPRKKEAIWVSIEISIGPSLEKVGPPGKCWTPLDPCESLVFSAIKPLDPLCKL